MYPHTPHVTEHDEPTMADLRGVLPGQRPPVDATVLNEPTSEVPMIGPPGARGGTDAGPDLEMERTIKARPATPPPTPEPEPDEAIEAEVAEAVEEPEEAEAPEDAQVAAAEPEAVTAEPEPEPEPEPEAIDTQPEAETTAEAETEQMEEETTVETPELSEPTALAAEQGFAPTPATTPPVVAAFAASPATEVIEATEPSLADGNGESEMAKMSWNPPPGLTITSPADLAAPEPVVAPEPAASRGPGDVAENAIALWTDEAADRLRGQWRDLQVQFIDDPNAAVTSAKYLVTEAVQELADTLLAAQDELDPFHGTDQVDTESMRVAMRRYREFLDRVLAL